MSDIISVLNNLGASAGHSAGSSPEDMLARLYVVEREVLISGDIEALAALAGARTQMACLIVIPEDAPGSDEQQEDQPADTPSDGELRAA